MKNTLLFGLFLTVTSVTFGQSLCFDPANDTRYSCNQWPRDIVSGDFDEDGHLDVVTGNNGNGGDFLHGNGDGTFAEAVAINGNGGDEIESTDFNLDGHLDIVRLTWDTGLVMVNLGNGDGTFQDGIITMSGITGDMNTQIALGDFDENGYTDIAINDPQNDRIKIIGNFNGNSFVVSPISVITSDNPVNVAAGDFNNDGLFDLVVAYATIANTDFFINTGLSYSVTSYPITGTVGNDLMEIEVLNFNNDMYMDVVAHGLGISAVYTNNGNGTMTASTTSMGTYVYGSIHGDWNNDGFADIATANFTSGGITVKMNNAGTFPNGTSDFSAHEMAMELCHGDFNEDGFEDIVTANDNAGNITYMEGYGDGSFGSITLLSAQNPTGMAAADFNGDGSIDLAAVNSILPRLAISLNNGDGTFLPTTFTTIPVGQAHQVATGDFNEDGNVDLVTHTEQGFMIFNGNGSGVFTQGVTIPSSSIGSGGNRTITVNDFNGDGHDDIAGTFTTNDELTIVYGNGNSTFSAALQLDGGAYPRYITSGDVNNDGRADIAVCCNLGNEARIFISTSNNNFQSPQILATGNSPEGLTFFHANNDSYIDFAIQSPNNLNLRVFEGSASGVFGTAHDFSLPNNTNASDLTHGDMNNDGKEDLIAAFYQMGSVGVMFGTGNYNFESAIIFDAEQWPTVVLTAEFNDDNAVDIAVLNSGSYNMSVILNNSAFITANGPTSFCEGESVTLTASEGYSYSWNSGETTQSIEVDTEGEYYCIISNQAGTCDLLTSTVVVNIEEAVNVTWNFPVEDLCLNSEPYVLGGAQPLGGIYTGPGVTNGVFDPAVAGIGAHVLTYTYASSANCFDGDVEATVNVVDALNVDVSLPQDTVCMGLDLVLQGGTPAGGDYLINGTEYASIFTTDFGPGPVQIVYLYQVSQNCQGFAETTLIIDTCIGIEEESEEHITVFPTIVESTMFITAKDVESVLITDAQGRTIQQITPLRTNNIDMSTEASGIYFIQVKTASKTEVFRIIKK